MNITVNQDKQQIGQDSVHFHGVILSNQGLQINPEKVTTIRKFERPSNATEVRCFLGMTNYCSRFIRGHAELTEPLRKLIVKSDPSSSDHPLDIHWTYWWYALISRIISNGYPVTIRMSCLMTIFSGYWCIKLFFFLEKVCLHRDLNLVPPTCQSAVLTTRQFDYC